MDYALQTISREFGLKVYFSAVVWMGDMNFRIRDFTREEVISKVQGKKTQFLIFSIDCYCLLGIVY